MNIIDAIKSGKPFRKSGGHRWLRVRLNGAIECTDGGEYILEQHDILWPDWEVEEQRISITKVQLEYAWERSFKKLTYRDLATMNWKSLAEELGFK